MAKRTFASRTLGKAYTFQPVTLAGVVVAVVAKLTQRLTLIGQSAGRISLAGTASTRLQLSGASEQRLDLQGTHDG